MRVEASPPWVTTPWPTFDEEIIRYYADGKPFRTISGTVTNSWYSSGGVDSKTKPASVKHKVNGVWLARPYVRELINQPRRSSHIMWRQNDAGGQYRTVERRGVLGRSYSRAEWTALLSHSGTYSSRFSNMRSRCEVECLLRLNGGDLDAGTALAESRKTADMLADAASKLHGSAVAASKGDFSSAARLLGVSPPRGKRSLGVDRKWLALQYGWLPLLGDIYGLHSELKKGLLARGQLLTAKARAQEDWETNAWSDPSPEGRQTRYHNYGVTVSIVARVADPFIAKIAGINLMNPASVAWELVPFSFVFDWFVPVGNTLRALSATAGLTFFTGSVSYRSFAKVQGPWPQTGLTSNQSMVMRKDLADANASALRLQRVALTSFPLPSIYANTSPFSTKRVLNALALISQAAR